MTPEQIASLSTILTISAGGIGWMIKRQAQKRDEAEKIEREAEKAEQAERVANTPILQQIVADQVQELIRAYATQNKELLEEAAAQRRRHAEDRRSWESERRLEREEWQRQVAEWETAKQAWDDERERFRTIIDELRAELAPYRKAKTGDEVKGG